MAKKASDAGSAKRPRRRSASPPAGSAKDACRAPRRRRTEKRTQWRDASRMRARARARRRRAVARRPMPIDKSRRARSRRRAAKQSTVRQNRREPIDRTEREERREAEVPRRARRACPACLREALEREIQEGGRDTREESEEEPVARRLSATGEPHERCNQQGREGREADEELLAEDGKIIVVGIGGRRPAEVEAAVEPSLPRGANSWLASVCWPRRAPEETSITTVHDGAQDERGPRRARIARGLFRGVRHLRRFLADSSFGRARSSFGSPCAVVLDTLARGLRMPLLSVSAHEIEVAGVSIDRALPIEWLAAELADAQATAASPGHVDGSALALGRRHRRSRPGRGDGHVAVRALPRPRRDRRRYRARAPPDAGAAGATSR